MAARTDITFTAAGSDPDGDTVYYRWDFGDDVIKPTTATVKHRWLKGGNFPVSVTALDGKGGMATTTFDVAVDDPLLNWTRRASGLTTQTFNDVIYAGGRFLAVGYGSNGVALSPDGVSWSLVSTGISNQYLYGVAHGGSRYVAVGMRYDFAASAWVGSVSYSADGLTWQSGTLPMEATVLNKVAYGSGRFVAVGKGGKIYHSVDGAAWSESPTGVTEDLRAIRKANGVFVVAGANGRILSSTDGQAWTNRTPATSTAYFEGVARHNGLWYVSTGYETWTSTDGSSWNKAPVPTGNVSVNSLSSGLGVLLAPSYSGKVHFTQDGMVWASTLPSTSNTDYFFASAEGNGTVVVVGSDGLIYQAGTPAIIAPKLSDAANLSQVTAGSLVSVTIEAAGFAKLELLVDGKPVDTIAGAGAILRWIPSEFGIHRLAVRGTTSGGATMTSIPISVSAAMPWTRRANGLTTDRLYDVTYAGGRFVAIGNGTTVLSPDGLSWTKAPVPNNQLYTGVIYGGDRFVKVGQRYDFTVNAWVGGASFST
ncbi:MAG: PKD domain-containing protein, partial [Rhodanobacter sp.]